MFSPSDTPALELTLVSRIHGCWLGKSIGGTLGLPAEGRMERLHFSFYDPVPTIAPPNDDLELQLVWLHLVEQVKGPLTREDFARAWLDHIHYMWDEYGRCRWNLRRGVPVESVGTLKTLSTPAWDRPSGPKSGPASFPATPTVPPITPRWMRRSIMAGRVSRGRCFLP